MTGSRFCYCYSLIPVIGRVGADVRVKGCNPPLETSVLGRSLARAEICDWLLMFV